MLNLYDWFPIAFWNCVETVRTNHDAPSDAGCFFAWKCEITTTVFAFGTKLLSQVNVTIFDNVSHSFYFFYLVCSFFFLQAYMSAYTTVVELSNRSEKSQGSPIHLTAIIMKLTIAHTDPKIRDTVARNLDLSVLFGAIVCKNENTRQKTSADKRNCLIVSIILFRFCVSHTYMIYIYWKSQALFKTHHILLK